MSTSAVWFEATNLVIETGATRLSAPSIAVATPYVALLDRAAALLPLLLQPKRWTSGHVTLAGRPLTELLASGHAGYAPLELPGDERLGAVLETSAELVGAGRRDVARAAALVGLGDALSVPLTRLTRVQMRLGGLAHALMTEPRFLLLDDLLVDLEPHEADRVELALDAALGQSPLDPAARGQSASSRSMATQRLALFGCHSRSRRSLARLYSHRARKEAVTVLTAARTLTRTGAPSPDAGSDAVLDYLIGTASVGSLAAASAYLELGPGEVTTFARRAAERGLTAIPLPGGHRVQVARADQERAIELVDALGLSVVAVEEAHFVP